MATVEIWKTAIVQLSGTARRRVYACLPDSYQKSSDRRYPVLYMFDGHNVFFDRDATYGKSWGMLEYMNASKKELIIIAVECNIEADRRLSEYSPFDFSLAPDQQIRGRGAEYMQWLTETLKPYIDSHFRTLKDPENTLICGSSMGGLMALYAVSAYNHLFHRAACLSPSLWVAPDCILSMLNTAKFHTNTRIYLDYGSEELDQKGDIMSKALADTANVLMNKGVGLTLRIIPGGTHCEASWERQIPVFMQALNV